MIPGVDLNFPNYIIFLFVSIIPGYFLWILLVNLTDFNYERYFKSYSDFDKIIVSSILGSVATFILTVILVAFYDMILCILEYDFLCDGAEIPDFFVSYMALSGFLISFVCIILMLGFFYVEEKKQGHLNKVLLILLIVIFIGLIQNLFFLFINLLLTLIPFLALIGRFVFGLICFITFFLGFKLYRFELSSYERCRKSKKKKV